MAYYERITSVRRESAIHTLGGMGCMMVSEDGMKLPQRRRVTVFQYGGHFEIRDISSGEVLAKRKTPKGAISAADKIVAGEKVKFE